MSYLDGMDFLRDGVFSEVELTVKEVWMPGEVKSEKDGSPIDKIVVSFEETDKRLIVGPTIVRRWQGAMKESRERQWAGKKVVLFPVWGRWSMGQFGIRPDYKSKLNLGIPAHMDGVDIRCLTPDQVASFVGSDKNYSILQGAANKWAKEWKDSKNEKQAKGDD